MAGSVPQVANTRRLREPSRWGWGPDAEKGAGWRSLLLLVRGQLGLGGGKPASPGLCRRKDRDRPPVCASMHPMRWGEEETKRDENNGPHRFDRVETEADRPSTAQARGGKSRRLEVLNLEESDDAVTGFRPTSERSPPCRQKVQRRMRWQARHMHEVGERESDKERCTTYAGRFGLAQSRAVRSRREGQATPSWARARHP